MHPHTALVLAEARIDDLRREANRSPVPTVGSRWEANNRTLFFTADTGPAGAWRDQARGVDVLLCEASYQGAVENKEYPST